jgi:putative Holliday junction resolvase
VVGLPLSLDGSEGASAASARELAGTIADLSARPVELWDERLTTARALSSVRAIGGSTRGRKAEVDALAAAVLLQNFLDTRRNSAGAAEGTHRAEGPDGSRQESSDR